MTLLVRCNFFTLFPSSRRLAVVAVLALAACGGPSSAQRAALAAGRDAARPCQERFHRESGTYADCVRFIAQRAAAQNPTAADWHSLGALQQGWVSAALQAQYGDADAEAAARRLLAEATSLQARLGASDALLCESVGMPCTQLSNLRQTLQAPSAASPQ